MYCSASGVAEVVAPDLKHSAGTTGPGELDKPRSKNGGEWVEKSYC